MATRRASRRAASTSPVAKLVGVDRLLEREPQSLSGGQKQRLALARAILADPRILILDEATANVDTVTEVLIQEALERLMEGRTSVVIAHRLSTIRRADMICVVQDGRIVERGTHEELMALGGVYRDLHDTQFLAARDL